MKKLSIVLVISVLFFSSCETKKENEFLVKGNVKGLAQGKIYLSKQIDKNFVTLDSCIIKRGKFQFKKEIGLPELYYLSIEGKNDYLTLFLEPKNISVQLQADSIDGSIVTGSLTNDLYQTYRSNVRGFEKKMKEIYYQYKEAEQDGNETLLNHLDSAYEKLSSEKQAYVSDFIKQNNSSVVSPYLVRRELIYNLELKELEDIVNLFDISISESIYTKALFDRIQILRKVDIGQPAPEINLNDSMGHPIALSSLKGNCVLIDFWASWCKPCRAENPNVVKLFTKYNKKGFTVYSVSLDNDRKAWIEAIKNDRLTWNHVSDLQGWSCSAAALYGVNSIPHTVLLDKDGVIIAKNLRGDDLTKKLSEIYNY